MTDSAVEGTWVFDTDTTEVTWKNWVDWTDPSRPDPPNGGTDQNCAWMLKQFQKSTSGHGTKAWADDGCSEGIDEMSVVCEKGEDIFVISFIRYMITLH